MRVSTNDIRACPVYRIQTRLESWVLLHENARWQALPLSVDQSILSPMADISQQCRNWYWLSCAGHSLVIVTDFVMHTSQVAKVH